MVEYIDFIAKLGVAAAHPGGFTATKDVVAKINMPVEAKILPLNVRPRVRWGQYVI